MALLSWIPGYSVNNEELDSHHQKMFHILNTVYEKVMSSLEVECILPIIDELSEHLKFHISAEEQHMTEKDVPNSNDHIAQHWEITQKMEILKKSYNGNNLEHAIELIILLGEWLLHHVINENRNQSEFPSGNSERANEIEERYWQ